MCRRPTPLHILMFFMGGWSLALYACDCRCTFSMDLLGLQEHYRSLDSVTSEQSASLKESFVNGNAEFAQAQAQSALQVTNITKALEALKTVNGKPVRTVVMLMTGSQDDYHAKKVKELSELFGKDFYVSFNNKKKPEWDCPHRDYAQCIERYNISETRKLSHKCCAQEQGIMWAMNNRHNFDYIWFMEDDAHYTDIPALLKVMLAGQDPAADVINQEEMFDVQGWWYEQDTREKLKAVFSDEQLDKFHAHSMMNFYRLSRTFLDRLEEVFHGMDQTWTFFEGLYPTVAQVYGLTWTQYERPILSMRNRPCVTEFNEPGIYHPVKYRNGQLFPCQCFDDHCFTFPNLPECAECPAIRAADMFDLTIREKKFAGLETVPPTPSPTLPAKSVPAKQDVAKQK